MPKNSYFFESSEFLGLLNELNSDVSIDDMEKKIIAQAIRIFDGKWGTIKYFYGDQFVEGFSSVPKKLSVAPRKRGYTFKTFEKRKVYALTHEQLRKIHPETSSEIRKVVLAPLFNSNQTIAAISVVSTNDGLLKPEAFESLSSFGALTGRVLKAAHHLESERQAVLNRDKFISFAAHELKNPIMALGSYNAIIAKTLKKKGDIQPDWLEKMQREVVRMQHLIEELLNVDHVQTGELNYIRKPISLSTLLSHVGDSFKIRTHRKLSIHFSIDKNTDQIFGDDTKLSQVFLNLLNNADKFSPSEELVTVRVREKGSFFEISIQDKGIGIPPEETSNIFTEFYRGSNSGRKKGIGVGLFLVKSIVQRHNGKIEVESELGKGTTFRIYLPKYTA